MASIFRPLLVISIKRKPAPQPEAEQNFLLVTTPTLYTIGSSLEWPTPPYIDREQPDYASAYPLFFTAPPPPPPIASTLMGQACL